MIIRTVINGPLQVNCYIVVDEVSKKAVVIDPGDEPDRIMDVIKSDGFEVEYIICTHGHFDHVGAVIDIKKETGARVAIHKEDLDLYNSAKDAAFIWGFAAEDQPAPDVYLKDGDIIRAGGLSFEVIYSPGHSTGGICLYSGDVVVTGDTLFEGSVGRTDMPGGDIGKLKKSFQRLMALPEKTKVLPGHGPASTIGREKKENMFSAEFLS